MDTKFMPWQFLWLKVIAAAWSHPDFRTKLIEPDADAKKLIEDEFKLDGWWPLPSWVQLKVKTPPEAHWWARKQLWVLPPTEVVWRIQARPATDKLAIELADFAEKLAEFETDAGASKEYARSVVNFAKRSVASNLDLRLIEKMCARPELIQKLIEPRGSIAELRKHLNFEDLDASEEVINQHVEHFRAMSDEVGRLASLAAFKVQPLVGVLSASVAGGAPLGSPENPLTAFDQMVRWLRVWPHVIALAWKDEDFKEYLKKAPEATLGAEFELQIPQDTKLIVEDDDPKKLPVDLVMILPPPPPDEDGALALASYFESGRSNPFTAIGC